MSDRKLGNAKCWTLGKRQGPCLGEDELGDCCLGGEQDGFDKRPASRMLPEEIKSVEMGFF